MSTATHDGTEEVEMAGPQHCHPRARVPVPGCSEVSQPGLPSCGVQIILD
jgi:hypothetical protein